MGRKEEPRAGLGESHVVREVYSVIFRKEQDRIAMNAEVEQLISEIY